MKSLAKAVKSNADVIVHMQRHRLVAVVRARKVPTKPTE
jgi:hypothetical protein